MGVRKGCPEFAFDGRCPLYDVRMLGVFLGIFSPFVLLVNDADEILRACIFSRVFGCFPDSFIDVGLYKVIPRGRKGRTDYPLEVLVRDSESGGIELVKPFPVLLQSMHVRDDVITFFGMCLS